VTPGSTGAGGEPRMAAAVPISVFLTGRKANRIALAALGAMALVRLAGLSSDARLTYPTQPSRLATCFLCQQPAARVTRPAWKARPRHLRDGPRRWAGKISGRPRDPSATSSSVYRPAISLQCLAGRRFDGARGRGDPQRPKHFSFRHLRACAGRHHDRFEIPGDTCIARRQSLRSSCRAQLF